MRRNKPKCSSQELGITPVAPPLWTPLFPPPLCVEAELVATEGPVEATIPAGNDRQLAVVAQVQLLDDVGLAQTQESSRWRKGSSGVEVDERGTKATYTNRSGRQAVVSSDWAYGASRRSWTVIVHGQKYEYGSVHVGLTAAQVVNQFGETVVFDAAGNFRMGNHPVDIVHMCEANDWKLVHGMMCEPSAAEPSQYMTVVADLQQERMSVTLCNGTRIHYPLPGWRQARLCASLLDNGDSVTIV